MIFRENANVRLADFDAEGRLTPKAALVLFENAGSHHSDSVNDSVIDSTINGSAYVLTEWRIEFSARPVYGEGLTIETWICGKTPASSFLRNFYLRSESGEILVRACAKLVMLSMETGRLLRITDETLAPYGPEAFSAIEEPAHRIAPPAEFEKCAPLAVRRADIDYNGHVHNTFYLDYALEVLPGKMPDVTAMRIVYLKPVTAEDAAEACLADGEGKTTVCIRCGGKICTVLEFFYEKS